MNKAKLIPLVYFFRRHVSATSAAFASLRPTGITCIMVHGFDADALAFGETRRQWRFGDAEDMHVVAKSAKKGRSDAEDAAN